MKLVAFDGDDTLWTPLNGVCISDRTPTDAIGRPDFTYEESPESPLVIRREDGARFALRPDAREVLEGLRRLRVLTGVVSYNHEANVRSVLNAFGIARLVDYVVAEWHTDKGVMLGKMLTLVRRDGFHLEARDVLLVDDDPWDLYRAQSELMGVQFRKFGADVSSLRELLDLFNEAPAS